MVFPCIDACPRDAGHGPRAVCSAGKCARGGIFFLPGFHRVRFPVVFR